MVYRTCSRGASYPKGHLLFAHFILLSTQRAGYDVFMFTTGKLSLTNRETSHLAKFSLSGGCQVSLSCSLDTGSVMNPEPGWWPGRPCEPLSTTSAWVAAAYDCAQWFTWVLDSDSEPGRTASTPDTLCRLPQHSLTDPLPPGSTTSSGHPGNSGLRLGLSSAGDLRDSETWLLCGDSGVLYWVTLGTCPCPVIAV